MAQIKNPRSLPKATTKERVLSAAERLLRVGEADFSMRDLAAEAGVSFATPFNLFGSKVGIIRALSASRIAIIRERIDAARLPKDVSKRVLASAKIAVEVIVAQPDVNRAILAAINSPHSIAGGASTSAVELWAPAIGKGEGLNPSMRSLALAVLPRQLGIAFRGVLAFWTAGQFTDDELLRHAQAAAAVVLLGFVAVEGRAELEKCLAAL